MSPEARRALDRLEKGWRVPDWPSAWFAADVERYRAREAEFAAAVRQKRMDLG